MESRFIKNDLIADFKLLGLSSGDTVIVRAGLRSVGPMENRADTFLEALLDVIGEQGTLVGQSYTSSYFLIPPDPKKPFNAKMPTYAGAFVQKMIEHPGSKRSKHPTCSYVAIGKYSELITNGHGPDSPAYEPVRKIIELNGKMIIVGCVGSHPGFATMHLAEYDLGLMNRIIFPWLNACYYEDAEGSLKLFRRKDLGLCSRGAYRYYGDYVKAGILRSGFIGNAYSIMVPAGKALAIEKEVLSKNPKFNICHDRDCFQCNARRWDRIHTMPAFLAKRILRIIKNHIQGVGAVTNDQDQNK